MIRCRATSSPANIPTAEETEATQGREYAHQGDLPQVPRYYHPPPPPSRLRIDPFPLPLFPSLRVSRFIRPVRNPEIAHAHRRATSSTISDGTSSRAFLGGWISIDRPEMFSTWNLFSRLGMRDEEKEKRIIPYRIESRFLSFFSIRERIQIFEECAFPSFLLAKKKKKTRERG